jgi:hypothetical protein
MPTVVPPADFGVNHLTPRDITWDMGECAS